MSAKWGDYGLYPHCILRGSLDYVHTNDDDADEPDDDDDDTTVIHK